VSIFDTVNPAFNDGPSGAVAYGTTQDVNEGFNIAYEEQVRNSSVYGLEHFFGENDDAQAKSWVAQSDGSKAPRIGDIADYADLARYLVDGEGLTPEQVFELDRYDDAVMRARENGMKVSTVREVVGEVQKSAQRAEADLEFSPTTMGGSVGQFVGGVLASVDPRTDPFNFATLPIGGAGKSIVGRIATQAIGQGAIEAVNQATGVQENRRLLGLNHGVADAALRVGFSAVGGAALQGVAEGAGVLARRWFSRGETPLDMPSAAQVSEIAPEAPRAPVDVRATEFRVADNTRSINERSPWSGPPSANLRTDTDLAAVVAQLDDWNGPQPWRLNPTFSGDTAVGPVVRANTNSEFDIRVAGADLDGMARQIDPQTFKVYDDLVAQKKVLREDIEALDNAKQRQAFEDVQDVAAEAAKLRAKASVANQKNAKKLNARADKLEAERDAKLEAVLNKDTDSMRAVRREIMRLDEKMRDMAPVMSRSYARARGQWAPVEKELEATVDMIREANTRRVNQEVFEANAETPATTPVDSVMQNHPDIADAATIADDAADVVSRAMEREIAVADADANAFRSSMNSVKPDDTQVEIDGQVFDLDEDRIVVEALDGDGTRELTLREFIEEAKQDELELQSVLTCSISKAS